jgi:hypothetical protein
VCARSEHENGHPPVASLPAGGPDFVWDSAVKHVPDFRLTQELTSESHLERNTKTGEIGRKICVEFLTSRSEHENGGKRRLAFMAKFRFTSIYRFNMKFNCL